MSLLLAKTYLNYIFLYYLFIGLCTVPMAFVYGTS